MDFFYVIVIYIVMMMVTSFVFIYFADKFNWCSEEGLILAVVGWPLGLPILLLCGFRYWVMTFDFYIAEDSDE